MVRGMSRLVTTAAVACTVLGVLAAVPGESTASTTDTAAASTSSSGALFMPVAPVRVLDTRTGLGAARQSVASHQSVTLQVGGATVVPWNASAVAVNVTVVSPTAGGFVSVGPSVVTDSSNLNFAAGQTIANLAISRLSSSGSITFYNGSTGAVQLLADLQGYYLAAGAKASNGTRYTAMAPVRVLDTRSGLGAPQQAVGAGESLTLQVTGTASVPATASAAVVNITVASPAAKGFVSVGPASMTDSSNLNFVAGRTAANLAITRLSATGSITFYNGSTSTVQLIADLQGYYSALGTGTAYTPVAPVRVLDTRSGLGAPQQAVAASASLTLQVTGTASVPSTASAVVVNITVANPSANGFVSVGPAVITDSSNVNFAAGRTVANLAVARLSSTGSITFYNGSTNTVQLIADVQGYTTPAGTCGGTCTVSSWSPTDSSPTPVSGPTNVVAVASGLDTGYALRADGTVWAWGTGTEGQLGNGVAANSPTPVQVSGLSNVTAIAADGSVAFAVRSDGTVWAWGQGVFGELGGSCKEEICPTPARIPGLADVVAVASGLDAEYALRADGTVWAWGEAELDQLGSGTAVDSFSATPLQVKDLTNVTAIAGGFETGYALRSDGTVWAWGWSGGLGNGGTADSNVPVRVGSLTQITAIGGGRGAVRSDGTFWVWQDQATPVQVSGLTGVTGVASGDASGYALRSDGTVWDWHTDDGSVLASQVGGLSNVTAVAAGGDTRYALVDTPAAA